MNISIIEAKASTNLILALFEKKRMRKQVASRQYVVWWVKLGILHLYLQLYQAVAGVGIQAQASPHKSSPSISSAYYTIHQDHQRKITVIVVGQVLIHRYIISHLVQYINGFQEGTGPLKDTAFKS